MVTHSTLVMCMKLLISAKWLLLLLLMMMMMNKALVGADAQTICQDPLGVSTKNCSSLHDCDADDAESLYRLSNPNTS